jgi:hypothetical protein
MAHAITFKELLAGMTSSVFAPRRTPHTGRKAPDRSYELEAWYRGYGEQ